MQNAIQRQNGKREKTDKFLEARDWKTERMASFCSRSSSSSTLPIVTVSKTSSPRKSVTLMTRPPKGIRQHRRLTFTRMNAGGLTEIEPDLIEEKRDRWATGGISPDDFVYGEYDGHHSYFEGGEKPSFWVSVKEEYDRAEPPSGFQGLISWLFFPAVITGLAYHVPGEYLYIGAGIFVVVFCGIEIGKPDKPHNFEPQIYNLEKESRDKLLSEYNTMDIWDFNEKYGDLWDFTVKRDKL